MRNGLRMLFAAMCVVAAHGTATAAAPLKKVCSGGKPDQAIVACNSLIKSGQQLSRRDQSLAYTHRGIAYGELGDYGRALADFAAALRIDPKNELADTARGIAYRKKGDYDRAIDVYSDFLRRHPRDWGVFNDRGAVYGRKQDYDRAIADFSAAIKLKPDYVLAINNRAHVYSLKRDFDRALADHDRVVELAPTVGRSYYERGRTYEAQESYARALADYRHALTIAPDVNRYNEAVARVERRLATTSVPAPARSQTASAAAQAAVTPERAPPQPDPAVVHNERRVALVIGNGDYRNVGLLPNPKSDAATLAATLKRVGFDHVSLKQDLTREQLVEALKDFAAEAAEADWAIVYYAGHGIEFRGSNYLIPVDARLKSDRDVTFETVTLNQVLQSVDGARKLRLVILDACRDNPFVRSMTRSLGRTRSIGRGLGNVEPEGATLVAYAAKHGQLALDGTGKNSPYVSALVRNLPTPGLEINLLFRKVRDEVLKATGRRQEPFTYGSLPSEAFYFKPPAG